LALLTTPHIQTNTKTNTNHKKSTKEKLFQTGVFPKKNCQATAKCKLHHAGWQHSAWHFHHLLGKDAPFAPEFMLPCPLHFHPQVETINGGMPTAEAQGQPGLYKESLVLIPLTTAD